MGLAVDVQRIHWGGGLMSNSGDSRDLVVVDSLPLDSWTGAAARGLDARREREKIISSVLKSGADFGIIPGTNKPTLLKPGAEKIADSLNLWPDYVCEEKVEDWNTPLFFYRYRAILRSRGSNSPVASGIGSCNSMEDRYRWRKAERSCPSCKKDAIIVGKAEYGGGFLCFKKKGGCGAKYADTDERITSQLQGRVVNDDVFSLVNTIDKMAQKRALVAASLNLGFSEHFTQDMEDLAVRVAEPPPQAEPASYDPVWDDATAAVPEPDAPGDAQEPALSKVKQALHEELSEFSPKQRDALIRKYSQVVGADGKAGPVVESLDKMLSPAISEKWAATTLGRIREARKVKAASEGAA